MGKSAQCFDDSLRHQFEKCAGQEVPSESAGCVSDFEMSPELKELLDNTPTLTDEDVLELGEAIRKLGLPWWKRILEALKQND